MTPPSPDYTRADHTASWCSGHDVRPPSARFRAEPRFRGAPSSPQARSAEDPARAWLDTRPGQLRSIAELASKSVKEMPVARMTEAEWQTRLDLGRGQRIDQGKSWFSAPARSCVHRGFPCDQLFGQVGNRRP